jgi:hypothetical protein
MLTATAVGTMGSPASGAGGDHPIAGTSLTLKDKSRPASRSVQASSIKNDFSGLPDPRSASSSVRIIAGAYDETFALDAGDLRTRSDPVDEYRYENDAAGATIRRVTVKTAKGHLTLRGAGAMLPSLMVDPGSVQIVVTVAGDDYCMSFGGRTNYKTGVFVARRAPAPASCPA